MFKSKEEFEEALAKSVEAMKDELEKSRCWEGYEPVPGKKPYSDDSCRPAKKADVEVAPEGSTNRETYQKEFEKDDAPHEPGSPEDSAHDIVEGASLEDEIKDLSSEERKDMLAHLRTLKDKRKHRSEDNKRKGMDKVDYNGNAKGGSENDDKSLGTSVRV